jgi:hypothetical protein
VPTEEASDMQNVTLEIYLGGVIFKGKYMSDKKQPCTELMGSVTVSFPIDKTDVFNAVNSILYRSTMRRKLLDREVVCLETENMIPSSAPSRHGKPLLMHECIVIEDTFGMDTYNKKKLHIVIINSEQAEVSATYVGGSDALTTDKQDKHNFAVRQWAKAVSVDFRRGNERCFHGMVVAGSTPEEVEESAEKLANYLLSQSVDVSPQLKVKEIVQLIDDELEAQSKLNQLPSEFLRKKESCQQTVTPVSLTDQFLSETYDITAGPHDECFLVRLRNKSDCPPVSRTKEWLLDNKKYIIDVVATNDCGRGGHIKKDTWCYLHVIHAAERAFNVQPILTGDGSTSKTFNIHWKHFKIDDCDMIEIDSDSEY